VAGIPEEEFEKAVESDDPPTATALAWPTEVPEGFNASIHLAGALRRFGEKCEESDPIIIASALRADGRRDLLLVAHRARSWLSVFTKALEELENELPRKAG
jgi:hypothetical protein